MALSQFKRPLLRTLFKVIYVGTSGSEPSYWLQQLPVSVPSSGVIEKRKKLIYLSVILYDLSAYE